LANGQVEENLPDHLPSLTPESDLLRMLTKKAWLTPGGLSDAFLLRRTDVGLSVCFECSVDHCMVISALNKSYGAAGLKVQSVTALTLTVEPDSAHHAEIRGLPSKETDSDRAEFLASQLAKAATIVDTTRRPE
jgi:hypothetical protein